MKYLLPVLALFFAIACNPPQRPESKTADLLDTIGFTYDSLKQISKAGSHGPAEALIIYPKFSDARLDSALEARVSAINPEWNVRSYQSILATFIRNYEQYVDRDEGSGLPWSLEARLKVVLNAPQLISVLNTLFIFEGGAHPNTVYLSYNIDPANAGILTIDSLIIPGRKGDLNTIAERIFRENENLGPGQSLAQNYFFESDVFSLPLTFNIKHEGLIFTYSPYEIKPYAAGKTELLIPAEMISPLLREKYRSLFNYPNRL